MSGRNLTPLLLAAVIDSGLERCKDPGIGANAWRRATLSSPRAGRASSRRPSAKVFFFFWRLPVPFSIQCRDGPILDHRFPHAQRPRFFQLGPKSVAPWFFFVRIFFPDAPRNASEMLGHAIATCFACPPKWAFRSPSRSCRLFFFFPADVGVAR